MPGTGPSTLLGTGPAGPSTRLRTGWVPALRDVEALSLLHAEAAPLCVEAAPSRRQGCLLYRLWCEHAAAVVVELKLRDLRELVSRRSEGDGETPGLDGNPLPADQLP